MVLNAIGGVVRQGTLVSTQYAYWKNDPYPVFLVSGFYHDGRVAGVNIHYLTFPLIQQLLKSHSGDPTFTYVNIKANFPIVKAFRTYKRQGLQRLKIVDTNYLKAVISASRKFNPSEIDKIRLDIQQQLQKKPTPSAKDLVGKPASIPTTPASIPTR